MASITITTTLSQFHHIQTSKKFSVNSQPNIIARVNVYNMQQNLCTRPLLSCNFHGRGLKQGFKPIFAVGSGLEASITEPEDHAVTLKDAKIVVESQDENKMQLRVDVNGAETQKAFDKVLTDLARSAPPIPGFRRQKGGKLNQSVEPAACLNAGVWILYFDRKTTKVPKDFLLQILGEKRVTNFVIQEIVSSTMADYVKKENLNVKDKKINTTQTAEELKKLFTPGNEFGFNVVLELEKTETETETLSSSSPDV